MKARKLSENRVRRLVRKLINESLDDNLAAVSQMMSSQFSDPTEDAEYEAIDFIVDTVGSEAQKEGISKRELKDALYRLEDPISWFDATLRTAHKTNQLERLRSGRKVLALLVLQDLGFGDVLEDFIDAKYQSSGGSRSGSRRVGRKRTRPKMY